MPQTTTNNAWITSLTAEAPYADLWWDQLNTILVDLDSKLWPIYRTVLNSQTVNYTVLATDRNKVIDCTGGSFTVSLTAAVMLGAGWRCCIRNSNTTTGIITIDPNGSETINLQTTMALAPGDSVIIDCDASNFNIWASHTKGIVFLGKTSAYTLTKSDFGKMINVSSASSVTVTLPQNSTSNLVTGWWAIITRDGSGAVPLAVEGSDVLTAIGTGISPQYGACVVTKKAAGDWRAYGQLA